MKDDQSFDKIPTSTSKMPFNVETELNYKRIFVVKEKDPFKINHLCQPFFIHDYQIYGELPDKSKKLLFTVSEHFQCKCCDCDDWGINILCFSLICCDKILFQLDYKKNNKGFYTQGLNQKKGCYICSYCCACNFCCCCNCCTYDILYLRENTDHNNPDFDVGIKKGRTITSINKYNLCCPDRTSLYITEENLNGYGIKATCSEVCKRKMLRKCCDMTTDFEIEIEDEKGNKCGNIMFYSGLFSKLVEGKCCYMPKPFFEINMPQNASSRQKFQIIADAVHFDYINNLL
jgi:hypothetical protein